MLQVHDSNGFLKIGGVQSIQDDRFNITGSTDVTKRVRFEVDGLTTSTTRTITPPDADIEIQGTHDVQSSNWQARNHGLYTAIASATVTDPGTPAAGHEFTTLVRNGTLTTSRGTYAVAGTLVRSVWHSGSWTDYPYGPLNAANTWTAAQTFNGTLLTCQANGGTFGTGVWSRDANWGTYYRAPSGTVADFALADSANVVTLAVKNAAVGLGLGGSAPTAGNGLLQLASGTTKANGIAFGTDTFLYRDSAAILAMQDGNAIGVAKTGFKLTHLGASVGSYASIDFVADGSLSGSIFTASAAHSALYDRLNYGSISAHGIALVTNNTRRIRIGASGELHLFGGTPVTRPTYGAPTGGAADRTTFDTTTVTLAQLAQRVRALIDDFRARGDFA